MTNCNLGPGLRRDDRRNGARHKRSKTLEQAFDFFSNKSNLHPRQKARLRALKQKPQKKGLRLA